MLNQNKKIKKNIIPGDYQYKALKDGHPIQSQWHKNRLHLIKFLDFFNDKDIVLDVGCGSGNVILSFYSKFNFAIGIDNNKGCIMFLKNKLKELGIKNAKAMEMDIAKIKIKKRFFSKIVMTEIIEHFSEKEIKKILKEIREMLKPKGKLIITTPNYKSPWVFIEILLDVFSLFPKLWGEQHLTRFTKKKLINIIEESGFTVEKKGTLNTISPFVSTLSRSLADKLSYLEFKYSPIGSLIYLVAEKK